MYVWPVSHRDNKYAFKTKERPRNAMCISYSTLLDSGEVFYCGFALNEVGIKVLIGINR